MSDVRIMIGDCRETLTSLEAGSVQCVVTSPPYWGLRDYGHEGQIGQESTPQQYVEQLVDVFRQVHRVLADDGTLWLNLGDCYATRPSWGRGGGSSLEGRKHGLEGGASPNRERLSGLKRKDLVGIPWRVAFALQADGWWLRQEIVWEKRNAHPESVQDRCTRAHENVFMLTKSERYAYNAAAIREPVLVGYNSGRFDIGKTRAAKSHHVQEGKRVEKSTRNKRSVWSIATVPYDGAHFAAMPPKLVETCMLAGSSAGDLVLDPFAGSGTVGMVARWLGRRAVLCELNPAYQQQIEQRIVTPRQKKSATTRKRAPVGEQGSLFPEESVKP